MVPDEQKSDTNLNASFQIQYVLLVRHGSRDKPYDAQRHLHHLQNIDDQCQSNDPNLPYSVANRKVDGRPKSLSLAGWLAETLDIYGIKICAALCSDHLHAKETQAAYLQVLKSQNLCIDNINENQDGHLNPKNFWKDSSFHRTIVNQIEPSKNAHALMITGHQPQLGWIASCLIGKHQPLPLRQSEIACIQLIPNKKLLWAIAESNSKIVNDLRSKIKSKMDVAKFFAGFVLLLLGFVLRDTKQLIKSPDQTIRSLGHVGIFLVLLSLGFFAATVFAYDRLLMPSVFWSGKQFSVAASTPGKIPRRPPTQEHWMLYFNMTRAWNGLFTPGVMFLFLGLASFILAQLSSDWIVAVFITVFILVVPLVACRLFQPSLGFDD